MIGRPRRTFVAAEDDVAIRGNGAVGTRIDVTGLNNDLLGVATTRGRSAAAGRDSC
jgi:hypothetical protein